MSAISVIVNTFFFFSHKFLTNRFLVRRLYLFNLLFIFPIFSIIANQQMVSIDPKIAQPRHYFNTPILSTESLSSILSHTSLLIFLLISANFFSCRTCGQYGSVVNLTPQWQSRTTFSTYFSQAMFFSFESNSFYWRQKHFSFARIL